MMVPRTTFSRYGIGNTAYSFDAFNADKLSGSLTRVRLPAADCEMIFIAADADNDATVWIGGSGVSSAHGFPLAAGEATGWIPVENTNLIYYVCEDAGDVLYYMTVG